MSDHQPVANLDEATTDEDVAINIAVLSNDAGLEDGGLLVSITTAPANGTAFVEADLTVTYKPAAGLSGSDSFTYRVRDADGDWSEALVSVQTSAINDPPTAEPDVAAAENGTTVEIAPLINDSAGDPGDSLRIVDVAFPPESGSGTIGSGGQTIFYTPPDYQHVFTLSYTIADDGGLRATAKISVAVNAPTSGTGRISGRVTDPHGAGIYGVMIYAERASYRYGVTDADGNYTLDGLSAGGHRVSFTPPPDVNLAAEYYSDDHSGQTPTTVGVDSGVTVTGIDAQLERGGTISGIVTGADGISAEGVLVYSCCALGSRHTTVGADGTYKLVGLNAGDHTIQFVPEGQNLLRECYDDNASCVAPQTVHVELGLDVSGIDASLARGGTISGTIRDAAGVPVPGVTVDISPISCCGPGWASITSGADGAYLAVGLPTDQYRVSFRPPAGSDLAPETYDDARASEPTPVPVVAGSDITGIDAVLVVGGAISGRVTDEAGVPLAGIYVDAYDPSTYSWGGAVTDQNGDYDMTGLPAGDYVVRFSPQDGAGEHPPVSNHLEEYFDDQRDYALATLVHVVAGEVTPGIDAALAEAAAISGRVTDLSGNPIENVVIKLGDHSLTSTREDGTYRATNLLPGEHILSFDPRGSVNLRPQWYSGADDESSATPLNLSAGETTGLDAVLKPGGIISGTVTDVEGNPIGEAFVYVYPGDSSPGDGWPIRYLSTNSLGQYRALGLSTGEYRVYFGANSFYSEWYDNATSASAIKVAVTAGQQTQGIDAELLRVNAPIVRDDLYSTIEDTSLSVTAPGVLSNDYSPTQRSASLVSTAAHGVVFLASDGSFSYQPIENFFGTDSFTYRVTNAAGSSEIGTVTIDVTGSPDAPVAVDDAITLDEDAEADIAVLANDHDPDGDPLTVRVVGGPGMGWAHANPDGTVHYWPSPELHEGDSFEYEISDGTGATAHGWVRITQRSVDDIPVANGDSSSISEGDSVDLNLLANDTGLGDAMTDGPLTVEIVTHPANGSAAAITDGWASGTRFSYTPTEDFFGTDSLTYRVTDPDGDSATAVWTIEVAPLPDAPVAVDDLVTTDEDIAVTVDALANDYDVDRTAPMVVAVGTPTLGTATLDDEGTISYTPAPQISGSDSFTYTIEDPDGSRATATVFVSIASVDDETRASQDGPYATGNTEPITIDVLANDSLNDGFGSLEILTQPSSGSVTVNPDYTITYTPDVLSEGRITFTYLVRDSDGDGSSATVIIDVASPLSIGGV